MRRIHGAGLLFAVVVSSTRAAHADGPSIPPTADTVTVRGRRSEAEQLQQSAEAVTVVDLSRARRENADLGEVLARTQGVAVARSGGLGSDTRFALDGLEGDHVRFFVDGVPFALAGYANGIAEIPVNLVDRVEIYRGVVPIRFGADALGGAVNFVTEPSHASRLAASYQIGSFGLRRLTLDGRYRHDPTGFVVGMSSFYDTTRNSYRVVVDVPNRLGQLRSVEVRRFHDGYEAFGGTVEAGFVDRPWAKRLLVRGFASKYEKDLQNNLVMTVPYGAAHYGGTLAGVTCRYEQALTQSVELEVLAGYSRRWIRYRDDGADVYDWFGNITFHRTILGESGGRATDSVTKEDDVLGRAKLRWVLSPTHAFSVTTSPLLTTRAGANDLVVPGSRDPLTARNDVLTVVTGLEHQLNLLRRPGGDDALQNIAFVKDYAFGATGQEPLSSTTAIPLDNSHHSLGVGDGLRLRFTSWLYAKLSYEYATRLPTTDEIFGDGVRVAPNLHLDPEVSHNGNVGPRIELRRTRYGAFTLDSAGFVRDSSKLIFLTSTDTISTYRNVYRARSVGIENAATWSAPRRWAGLDGTFTYQDVRNVSETGGFKELNGDRIPNRPWLFASWGGRFRVPGVGSPTDRLEPFYVGRYVHSFYRGWESQGLKQFKQVVDAQLTHGVGISWSMVREALRLTSTVEMQNVTNARVYDLFGAQRPGRTLALKITAEL